MEKRLGDKVSMSEDMRTFIQPMEVTDSLYRDLKLKRKKLSKLTSWNSDAESVKSDKGVYFRSHADSADGYSTRSENEDTMSVSSQYSSSVASLPELSQPVMEDEEEAQRRFEAFTNQVKQEAYRGKTSQLQSGKETLVQRDQQVPGVLKVPGLSNKVQQPCMNRTVCAEQSTVHTAPVSSSLTPMVSLQSMGASAVCTTSDVIMQPAVPLAVPATGVPQVVAFAALPAVSENMMPQVVAMATIPGASNQPQMVALPLCSWPYDPMMLNRLSGATPSASTCASGSNGQPTLLQPAFGGINMLPVQRMPQPLNTQTNVEDLSQRIFKSKINGKEQIPSTSPNILVTPVQQSVNGLIAPQIIPNTLGTVGNHISSAPMMGNSAMLVASESGSHPSVVQSQMKVSPTTVWASPEKQSLALGNHSGQEENNVNKQIRNGSEIGMTSYPGARGYQQVQFPQQYLPSEATHTGTISNDGKSYERNGEGEEAVENEVIICEICDDKATGLHYGIVTCEG